MRSAICWLALGWVALLVGCDRSKDSASPSPAAQTTASPTPTTELEGTYILKSETMDGQAAPPERIKKYKAIVIRGDQIIIQLIDGVEHPARIRLDQSKQPPHIDFVPSDAEMKQGAKIARGIYKVDKGELTIAFNDDDGERPTTFDSAGKKILQVLVKQ
jgi:uncharacterized protein (TIGR03067 family)